MKWIAIALLAFVMGLGALVEGAEAKRLGGGKSSGFSRDSGTMKREGITSKPAPGPAHTMAQTAPQSGMSRWLGPLAGIAAGLGIGALFSHLGLGAGLGNMMVILLLVAGAVFAVRLFARRRQPASGLQPAMQYAGPAGGAPRQPYQGDSTPPAFGGTGAAGSEAAPGASVPDDFDVEGFLRQAKLTFIRLQAANDRGDMEDIRQFCSPELAAEVQMQYQERNRQAQQTDILHLNAGLLDVGTEAGRMLASVRFSGQIREEAGASQAFREVWHLASGPGSGQAWLVVGIQQG